ncbi:hypothetical protein DFH09DRAFT_982198 [Mycena vulgaris]|nr:hypothetical protein DFH09DRAFT_982198 [Mycena vulgaris]
MVVQGAQTRGELAKQYPVTEGINQKGLQNGCQSKQPIVLEAEEQNLILIDLPFSASLRNELLADRVQLPIILPALSIKNQPSVHIQTAKDFFRAQHLNRLRQQWSDPFAERSFMQLVELMESDGSVFFGGLLDVSSFERLIARYTETLGEAGSKSFIHSYVDLADHPAFLTDSHFNGAFLHPLIVALIAYQMGGPMRLTNARGKDTHPISVLAQDNMLHIDNTPFTEEYKVVLAWEKGVARGPTGQNFVSLPGTHRGTRNVLISPTGEPWSTENASIFTSDTAIDSLFAFQHDVTGRPPTVVEAQHPEQPVTVAFSAGSLVHHRYRTEQGNPRSCLILAFHRASDDPGMFIATSPARPTPSLAELLIGFQDASTADTFLDVLAAHAAPIAAVLLELGSPDCASTLVDTKKITLEGVSLANWRAAVTMAPSVDDIKAKLGVHLSHPEPLSGDALLSRLCQAMSYDKHGLLDLILYGDGHEEVRKWARNRIREMRAEVIAQRIAGWMPEMVQPIAEHLLTPSTLQDMAGTLATLAITPDAADAVSAHELTGQIQRKSIRQLVIDLGEALVRCETMATFVSTSLFFFWAADDMAQLLSSPATIEAHAIARSLLRNYVASALLGEGRVLV